MSENETNWDDIDKARNMLLSRSDWTQLLDAGLSTACVMKWREWRAEVRKVSRKNYTDRISAKMRIRQLNDNQPKNVKGDLDVSYFLSASSVDVTRNFVREVVEEVLDDHGYEILDKERIADDVEDKIEEVKHEETFAELKQRVKDELHEVFVNRIKSISPDPALSILYIEMLNQSIDCLAGQGSYFPMLEQEYDLTPSDKANKNLEDHSVMIRRYTHINNAYLRWKTKLENDKLSEDELAELPSKLEEEIYGY